MQTFLPEVSFPGSAAVLDNKRLVKQLLECRQILNVLAGESHGWRNHPAVLQWRGHERLLYMYAVAVADELKLRNYKFRNNMGAIEDIMDKHNNSFGKNGLFPWWMEDQETLDRIMITHRARLYVKDSKHYAQYSKFVDIYQDYVCCDRCNYYWPTHERKAA